MGLEALFGRSRPKPPPEAAAKAPETPHGTPITPGTLKPGDTFIGPDGKTTYTAVPESKIFSDLVENAWLGPVPMDRSKT